MDKKYIGDNIAKILPTKEKRELYLTCLKQIYINYGDNVDWQKLKKQVLLCDETKDELYAQPKKIKYVNGTRPYLEAIVNEIIKNAKTEREIAIGIMCYCRDLHKKHISPSLYHTQKNSYVHFFYGGTEEELIKKGEWLCECLGGRLMVALCEIAGLSARGVMHVVRGHIATEVYVDGKWSYFDPRCGMFYLNENNEFCSVYEIVKNREIIKNQSDYVKSFVSDYWTYQERECVNYEICFNTEEIQCFCDYSLMDSDEYNFEWKSVDEAVYDGLFEISKEYSRLSNLIIPQ